jgi:nucleotidyltransferase substrate binding protein (TIGR01987 family)
MFWNNKMILDLTSLKKAITSLEKAITIATAQKNDKKDNDLNEVIRAGVIQNFEFTYELCWKFIKRWLEININNTIIDGLTRKELFRLAAENRLIDKPEGWFFYHKARNETSHTYNPEISQNIYLAALRFINDAKLLLLALESKND